MAAGSRVLERHKMIGEHAAAGGVRAHMTVDRSYSESEAIRTYHDRGMMKWALL